MKKKYKDNWETVLDCCDTILFLGSNSKETLEYITSLLGKKTWYKRSTGRTYSKQGSTSSNWDIVGRELATIDELSKMEKGYCILILSTIGAFYSKLYNLKKHPNYINIYDSWSDDKSKKYNHAKELKNQESSDYRLLLNVGLGFAQPIEQLTIESVSKEKLKQLLRIGIIQYEDLQIIKY